MISNDSDYETDDGPGDLFEGLEQLALALDARRYPGPAWSPPPVPHLGARGRRLAAAMTLVAGIAASACIAIAMICALPTPRPPVAAPAVMAAEDATAAGTAPGNEQAIPGSEPAETEVAESGSPQLVVVEDLDSYSLIDMSGSSPIVSYMSKDASNIESPVPVPLGLQPPPSTSDPML
jgi:hypothetical protein